MPKNILIIDGHPDGEPKRFCHALAAAYKKGADSAGHSTRRINVWEMNVDFLRSSQEWSTEAPSPSIKNAQDDIRWATHLVIIYPLWLGSMPAMLKAFLEQVFRSGFTIERKVRRLWPGLLSGKSARIVVTMGMPSWLYRWYFLAHSLKSLERNILRFSGIAPVHETLIGGVGELKPETAGRWLARLEELGAGGS